MATSNKRVSKHLEPQPGLKVEKFNIKEINSRNIVNHLLVMKESDFSYSNVMEILGEFAGKKVCNQYDTFDVPAGTYKFMNEKGKEVHNKSKFTTTVGIWMINIFLFRGLGLCHVVGGYVNENIDSDLFDDICQGLVYALIEDKIDTNVYRQFLDRTQFLMPYETILSPNHTEAIITCTKLVNKKKDELLKKYGDKLKNGDVVACEQMEKELMDYVLEELKDDPGIDVFLSGAGGSLGNNFKNMYVMKGAIKDPDPNAKQPYNIATSSFLGGIAADEYSLLANSMTEGPYGRGKKTEAGGHWEKLFATFQTVKIDEKGSDCGTKDYLTVTLTKKNVKNFMYNYIVKSDGKLEELTSDNVDKYIGKTVKMRFSVYCHSTTGICHACAGNFFYRRSNNRNIGLVCIQIPSTYKIRMMKAFHNSVVKTVEMDPMKVFSMR